MHHATLDVLQRAVRAKVCPDCYQRPMGSERLGPEVPRHCEPDCAVFVHLQQIEQILQNTRSASLAAYEKGIRDVICQKCHLSDSAGDYCSQWLTRTCPLSRQAAEIVSVLENVLRARAEAGVAEN